MAPRAKVTANPDSWWQGAYQNHPTIEAVFEYEFNGDKMVPGTKFKVKYNRGEFKFRCLATNTVTGNTGPAVAVVAHASPTDGILIIGPKGNGTWGAIRAGLT